MKANMSNRKLNVYKKVLQEVCEKFNGVEQYIQERIKELYSESQLSVDEIKLFVHEWLQRFFKSVLLKSYKHHFEHSVITLIFFSALHFL